MPLRIAELLTTSGASACAICQTNPALSRLIAVIVPYGGLTRGNPSTSNRLNPPPPAGLFGGLGESAPAFSPGPWRISTSLPAVPAMYAMSETSLGAGTSPTGSMQELQA